MLDYDKGIVTKTKIIFSIGIFSDSNNPIFFIAIKDFMQFKNVSVYEKKMK